MNESCLECEAALGCLLGLCDYYPQDGQTIVTLTGEREGQTMALSGPFFAVRRDCPGLLKKIARTGSAWETPGTA